MTYDLKQLEQAMYIAKGRQHAVLNRDELLYVISDTHGDPVQALMEKFSLSKEQATDIYGLKLSYFTRGVVRDLEQRIIDLQSSINFKMNQQSTLEQTTKPCDEFDPDNYDIADIRSAPGTPVVFLGVNGYPGDLAFAKAHLIVGKVYRLRCADIGNSYTYFQLKEIDGQWNSVMFGAVKK